MMPDELGNALLSISEFCALTRQSRPTYYNARKRGQGPVEVRFGPRGGKVFVRRADAEAWLLKHRQVPRDLDAPSETSEPIARPSEQAEQFA